MAKLRLTTKQFNKLDSIVNDIEDLQYRIESAGEEVNFGKKTYYILTAKELEKLHLDADRQAARLRMFRSTEFVDDNDPADA